jgi:hypothetical protein
MFKFKGLMSRRARPNRFRFTDHAARESRLVARSSRFEQFEDRRMLADGELVEAGVERSRCLWDGA